MNDNETIEQKFERLIRENKWEDREVQDALLNVARKHIWTQGLWARIKFWANIIGAFGIIGGLIMFLFTVLGWEIIRR